MRADWSDMDRLSRSQAEVAPLKKVDIIHEDLHVGDRIAIHVGENMDV